MFNFKRIANHITTHFHTQLKKVYKLNSFPDVSTGHSYDVQWSNQIPTLMPNTLAALTEHVEAHTSSLYVLLTLIFLCLFCWFQKLEEEKNNFVGSKPEKNVWRTHPIFLCQGQALTDYDVPPCDEDDNYSKCAARNISHCGCGLWAVPTYDRHYSLIRSIANHVGAAGQSRRINLTVCGRYGIRRDWKG